MKITPTLRDILYWKTPKRYRVEMHFFCHILGFFEIHTFVKMQLQFKGSNLVFFELCCKILLISLGARAGPL